MPDVDHVVEAPLQSAALQITPHCNPFIRYRRFLHSYRFAIERGLTDPAYVDLVDRLDDDVARVDGRGFTVTPLKRHERLEAALGVEAAGSVWVKDETGAVAGSHKARHLMGVMLYLEIVRALGLDDPRQRTLAIASCGNAALAAAVIARAAGYRLQVFVPDSANPQVIETIRALGAAVEVCRRKAGTIGDPSYNRFRLAIARGALPFCCQGPENGLTIEGGMTLWLEIAEALSSHPPERVFVQVGGGALASACVHAFTAMRAAARLSASPRIHAVQTRGAFPLKRAYDRVVKQAWSASKPGDVNAALCFARSHRSAFMRPWGVAPRSVAHGILDDETYDWAAVVEGMLLSAGYPVVVDEDELVAANYIARQTTGINVDHTGSAGLAGLMQLLTADTGARGEQTVVLFSGARRG